MAWVWVSIGSNIEREKHVRAAVQALQEQFGALVVSPVYETPAEGFDGNPFYNLVVGFDAGMTPAALHARLREIEETNGRIPGADKFSARTLDIDALTYAERITDEGGKHLPRDEITRYAFVLKPLADVAGEQVHPECHRTYAELWNDYRCAHDVSLKTIPVPGLVPPAAPLQDPAC